MSIYIGNKEIKHIFNGSKIVQKVYRGGVKIWEDTHLNSAGTATITYSYATGIASVVSIVGGPTIYAYTSSFSNLSTTGTATFSVNTGEELRIEPVISSGDISYKIEASNGLNAITKLSIQGRRLATSAHIYLRLPAMPNLKSVEFADEWNGGIMIPRGYSNDATFFKILSLCPKSHLQNQQLLILYN